MELQNLSKEIKNHTDKKNYVSILQILSQSCVHPLIWDSTYHHNIHHVCIPQPERDLSHPWFQIQQAMNILSAIMTNQKLLSFNWFNIFINIWSCNKYGSEPANWHMNMDISYAFIKSKAFKHMPLQLNATNNITLVKAFKAMSTQLLIHFWN